MAADREQSRRSFLKSSAAGAAALTLVKNTAQAKTGKAPAYVRTLGTNDQINLGFIGVGVRGKQHMRFSGFLPAKEAAEGKEDPTKNLPRPLNVRAAAVCDLYQGNLDWATSAAAKDAKVYRHHEDLLADPNVDAIFIGTSDHNHAPIGILAAKAGKAVYSEKCFANSLEAAKEYRDALKANNTIFQLGHQTRSGSLLNRAHKELGGVGPDGKIGKISLIEVYTNRNDPNAAWVYNIPQGAGKDNIDWKRFTGEGKTRPFDTDRFFRWRKYWDYGTGLAGDLMTHEMDAVQQVTGLGIPDTATATGGIYFRKDGRETPDVFQATFNYEKEELLVAYNATLANSWRRERTFFGHDGTMTMTHGIEMFIDADTDREEYINMIKNKQWVLPVGDQAEAAAREKVRAQTADTMKWTIDKGILIDVVDGKQINVTALHVLNFVECIRAGNHKTNCDVDAAFEEAVIAHMATQAFHRGRRVRWDPRREKIVNDA